MTDRSGQITPVRGKRTVKVVRFLHSPVKDLRYAAVKDVNRQRTTLQHVADFSIFICKSNLSWKETMHEQQALTDNFDHP